jgi:hypothetical protein
LLLFYYCNRTFTALKTNRMRRIYPAFLPAILLWSCTPPAYYMSPYNSNATYYHASPLHSDSVKTVSYVTGVFTYGGADDSWRDRVLILQGDIGQAKNFGSFGASYGAGLSLGNYHVKAYSRTTFDPLTTSSSAFSIPSSSRFFSSYGFNGSFHYVIPYKRGTGECRLGIETSVQHEAGNYLSFRKSLPDSAIDLLETARWTKVLGGYFDFIGKGRHGSVTGYKLAIGGSFVAKGRTYLSRYTGAQDAPWYISQTAHFTNEPATYFWQLNLGLHVGGLQFGVNYQLGN